MSGIQQFSFKTPSFSYNANQIKNEKKNPMQQRLLDFFIIIIISNLSIVCRHC